MRQENKEWWYHAHVRPEDWQIREAVRLYEEGWSQKEIAKKFNRSPSNIWNWINIFAKDLDNPDMNRKKKRDQKKRERAKRKFGITAPETVPVDNSVAADRVCPSEINNASEEELKARIAKLERELEDARLMRDFYDEMINIAEKDFNIPIRKKGGAKR